jgi:predicted Mrr-cat superfamily restriction endonuclease
MTRYWKISPGQGGFLWAEQRDSDCIALGWNWAGNLKGRTDQEIVDAFLTNAPASRRETPNKAKQLLTFFHEVKEEDKVIACAGAEGGKLYGLGTVDGDYRYAPELQYRHSKHVKWDKKFWAPLYVEELPLPKNTKGRLGVGKTILELESDEWKMTNRAVSKARSPFEGLTNFEGLSRAPESEQELIVLFSKMNRYLKMKIDMVQQRWFPDALIKVKKGKTWRSLPCEFELYSSGFKRHLSQVARDEEYYIICWKDDWRPKTQHLTVIELRSELQQIL